MTHYTVMVQIPKDKVPELNAETVNKYVSKVLEPYDENKEVKLYPYITREKCKEKHEKNKARAKENIKWLKDQIRKGNDVEHNKKQLAHHRKRLTALEAGGVELTWGEETWFDDQKFNKYGEPLTSYNPKSKWDWWVLGGRWSGKILVKGSDVPRDFARMKDVDMEALEEEWEKYRVEEIARYKSMLKEWEEEESPGLKKERLEWLAERIKETEEAVFAFATCAVLTKDGKWHEPARTGWFGMTYDRTEEPEAWDTKFKERFLDTLDPGDVIAVVDCHI